MDNISRLNFEVFVMELCEDEECKTVEDYARLADSLHQSIENAICDMCMDNGIDDYEVLY